MEEVIPKSALKETLSIICACFRGDYDESDIPKVEELANKYGFIIDDDGYCDAIEKGNE